MNQIFSFTNYRDYLQHAFEWRRERNPRYSLRAFARDLELSPSMVSEVLNGQSRLSPGTAREICAGLKLRDEEITYFCDLVTLESTTSESLRKIAEGRVKRFQQLGDYTAVSEDKFRIISDWYHFAIMELFQVQDFKKTFEDIALRLNLTVDKAIEAVGRLEQLGYVTVSETNVVSPAHSNLSVLGSSPSSAIRECHRQLVHQALFAMENHGYDERDHSAVMCAVPAEAVLKAREMIKVFRREFGAEMNKYEKKDHVYVLGVHFTRLTK